MSTCSAVGSIGCGTEKLSLQEVTGSTAVDAVKQSQFVELMMSGIEKAGSIHGSGDKLVSSRDEFSLASAGQVGMEKADLVSGARGTQKSTSIEGGQNQTSDDLIEKMRSFYVDTANYTVAWRMAQRVQQDISHIIKG